MSMDYRSGATSAESVKILSRKFTTVILSNQLIGRWRNIGVNWRNTAVNSLGRSVMPRSLYMVVERFKNKDAVAVYRRFRDNGRLAPEGLLYISSWVDDKLERCYQLMETHDRALLDEWMANWSDLVDFEVHAVITSKDAAEEIAPRL
jgi:hypothetical protein